MDIPKYNKSTSAYNRMIENYKNYILGVFNSWESISILSNTNLCEDLKNVKKSVKIFKNEL